MQGLALRCRELHCPGYFWKVCFPSQVCQQTHLTRQQLQVWHVGMHEYTHLDPKKPLMDSICCNVEMRRENE